MAFCIKRMRVDAGDEDQLLRVAETMIGRRIFQVIDLACLDDEDIESLVGPNDVEFTVRLRDNAKNFEKGWATLSVLAPSPAPPVAAVAAEPKFPAYLHKLQSKTSASSLKASMKSFTVRVALGRKVAKPAGALKHNSLACKSKSDMDAALRKVHSVFVKHASTSPRFMTLDQDVAHVYDMQLQPYRMGSRSARVVAQRARSAEAFFLDCRVLRIDMASATPFQGGCFMVPQQVRGWMQVGSNNGCIHSADGRVRNRLEIAP